ncbi:MAG TPA: hypothetical protein VGG02_08505 [Chthoniobacterales bacterium]|jgi:hypothetical protein
MEPAEALSTVAQIAVALAGFAGVVVVFRTESLHRWAAIDRFRLWLLLANSVIPLALALLAILLLAAEPAPVAIWRWCSGIAGPFLLLFAALTVRAGRAIPAPELQADRTARLLFYPLFFLGAAVTLLQFYNAIFAGRFRYFFVAIVFQLLGALLQFVRLILAGPARKN